MLKVLNYFGRLACTWLPPLAWIGGAIAAALVTSATDSWCRHYWSGPSLAVVLGAVSGAWSVRPQSQHKSALRRLLHGLPQSNLRRIRLLVDLIVVDAALTFATASAFAIYGRGLMTSVAHWLLLSVASGWAARTVVSWRDFAVPYVGLKQVRNAERAWLADRIDEPGQIGIALSGGGIRAASVSFGFIRALAEGGILAKASYVSTVSGGGWTGAGLAGAAVGVNTGLPILTGDLAAWDKLHATIKGHTVNYLSFAGDRGLRRISAVLGQCILGIAASSALLLAVLTINAGVMQWLDLLMTDDSFRNAMRQFESWRSLDGRLDCLFKAPRLQESHLPDWWRGLNLVLTLPLLVAIPGWATASIVNTIQRKQVAPRRAIQAGESVAQGASLILGRITLVWIPVVLFIQGRDSATALLLASALVLVVLVVAAAVRRRLPSLGSLTTPKNATRLWLLAGIAVWLAGYWDWLALTDLTKAIHVLVCRVLLLPWNMFAPIVLGNGQVEQVAKVVLEVETYLPPELSFPSSVAFLAISTIAAFFGAMIFSQLAAGNKTGLHRFWRQRIASLVDGWAGFWAGAWPLCDLAKA
jgi:hypothetical protein